MIIHPMIKNFKTFEGVEEDRVITEYIIGIPSGEVIEVTDDEFVKLKKQRLIVYKNSSKYFTFLDQNYKIIRNMISKNPERREYIEHCLSKFNITKFKINNDFSVDVFENVDISQKGLTRIPIKFKLVDGSFDCSLNKLTNLSNSPDEISGFFECSNNEIYTLIGGPSSVAGGYYCTDNKLEDLHGFPKYCQVCFDVSRNNIKTLKGCPEFVSARFFSVAYNKLKDLTHGPRKVMNFDCSHNDITTLVHGIRDANGNFDCTYNRLFNLMGMPSCDKLIYDEGNKIEVDYD